MAGKRMPFLVVLIIGTLLLAACGGESEPENVGGSGSEASEEATEELPVVRIQAFNGGSSNIAVKLIEENGFDVGNGFRAEYHYLDSDVANQFFFQNRSDVAFDIDSVGVAIARNNGINVTSFAGVVANHLCLAVTPDSPYDSVQDLEGKKVGHYGIDSGGTISLGILMEEAHGIDIYNDWELVESDPNGLLELLHRGDLDATVSIEPNISKETVTGESECMTPRFTEMWKESQGGLLYNSTIAAHEDWLEQNPELARGVVRAWQQALEWFSEHPEVLEESPFKELTGIEDPEALEVYAASISGIPLFTDSWTAGDRAAQEAFIDLAAAQGTLLQENPGGSTTDIGE